MLSCCGEMKISSRGQSKPERDLRCVEKQEAPSRPEYPHEYHENLASRMFRLTSMNLVLDRPKASSCVPEDLFVPRRKSRAKAWGLWG